MGQMRCKSDRFLQEAHTPEAIKIHIELKLIPK